MFSKRRNVLQSLSMLLLVGLSPQALLANTVSEKKESSPLKEQECKALRGLVILAEFPGTSHLGTRSFVEARFKALNQYIRDMSYGHFCLDTTITTHWHLLPSPVSRYKISAINLQVDQTRVMALVNDSFASAETEWDIAGYDFIAVMLGAQIQEFGMPGFSAYPGMLGWHPNRPLKTSNGKAIKGAAVFVWNAHLGTIFHDIAHVIGGLSTAGNRVMPCLYDHDLQAKGPSRIDWVNSMINMGFWDPMSCHFYNPEGPPPGLSSWSKLRLGWLSETKVKTIDPATGGEVLLGPLQDANSEILAVRIPISSSRYFLIENRQPIGAYDQELPDHGILIMKADDRIPECRNGKSPVRLIDANPDQKWLMGAAFNLPDRGQYIDQETGVQITLLKKAGGSYLIEVSKVAPDRSKE